MIKGRLTRQNERPFRFNQGIEAIHQLRHQRLTIQLLSDNAFQQPANIQLRPREFVAIIILTRELHIHLMQKGSQFL